MSSPFNSDILSYLLNKCSNSLPDTGSKIIVKTKYVHTDSMIDHNIQN